MPVKFPGPQDRVAIIGRTGSGKTTAAEWHLSGKDFNTQPWCIVDTKGDPSIARIRALEGAKTIDVNDTPGDNGLYIVAPLPEQQEELDGFFRRVWHKQNCGLYIDEGYMIEQTDGLNACLTQGRTRNIPMIILSQRPAWISKFVFSEADFVQLFNLQRLEDRKIVGGFVPVDKNYRLARYCSYWYNVADDELVQFGPVPNSEVILASFRARLLPPEQSAPTGQPSPVRKKMTTRVV